MFQSDSDETYRVRVGGWVQECERGGPILVAIGLVDKYSICYSTNITTNIETAVLSSSGVRGEDQYWLLCYKLLQNTICPEIHQPSLFWTFTQNQQRIDLRGKEELNLCSTSVSIM